MMGRLRRVRTGLPVWLRLVALILSSLNCGTRRPVRRIFPLRVRMMQAQQAYRVTLTQATSGQPMHIPVAVGFAWCEWAGFDFLSF